MYLKASAVTALADQPGAGLIAGGTTMGIVLRSLAVTSESTHGRQVISVQCIPSRATKSSGTHRSAVPSRSNAVINRPVFKRLCRVSSGLTLSEDRAEYGEISQPELPDGRGRTTAGRETTTVRETGQ